MTQECSDEHQTPAKPKSRQDGGLGLGLVSLWIG